MTFLRRYLARKRLQRIVDERCRSFEVQDYKKRREAALKGLAMPSARAGRASHRAELHRLGHPATIAIAERLP